MVFLLWLLLFFSDYSFGDINGLKVYIDGPLTDDKGYGDWFPEIDGEMLIINKLINEGDVVIDAGAHMGDWSELVLNHTNGHCKIFAFEPVPNFYEKMLSKLDGKCRCINSALGDVKSFASMNYYYEESEGCSSLYDRKVLSSIPVKKINVNIESLDDFCRQHNIDYINFLKIDTEGAEWRVLQGADKLISAGKIKYIQFEYGGTYPDANITLKQVYKYLKYHGYAIFRIFSEGLIFIPTWRSKLENFHLSNYLAIYRN